MIEPTWTIGPQTREAEMSRFAADIKRRLDRGAEEARNPHNPALRAAADLQDALRNERYLADLDGTHEAKRAAEIGHENKRLPWADRVRAA